jgi:hypothetical protein
MIDMSDPVCRRRFDKRKLSTGAAITEIMILFNLRDRETPKVEARGEGDAG